MVPTATFGALFGLVVLAHRRRRVVHFNATENPTAEWTALQLAGGREADAQLVSDLLTQARRRRAPRDVLRGGVRREHSTARAFGAPEPGRYLVARSVQFATITGTPTESD